MCRHTISNKSGIKIINTDHKRDKSEALEGLIDTVCTLSGDQLRMRAFIFGIRTNKPRYVLDQLLILKEALMGNGQQAVERALVFCLDQGINSGTIMVLPGKKQIH